MSNSELRVIARLAWNGWPDNENSRREIAAHEARDPVSAAAWDRVLTALLAQRIEPERTLYANSDTALEERVAKALRSECEQIFGSTWNIDNANRLARAAIEEVKRAGIIR